MEHAPKQRVNVTISSDLLEKAKAAGLNLSQASEAGISAALRKQLEQQWKEENAEAIAAYNAWYDARGPLFSPIWELE